MFTQRHCGDGINKCHQILGTFVQIQKTKKVSLFKSFFFLMLIVIKRFLWYREIYHINCFEKKLQLLYILVERNRKVDAYFTLCLVTFTTI